MAFHTFFFQKQNKEEKKTKENNKYSFLSCKLVLVLVKVLNFKGYQTFLTTLWNVSFSYHTLLSLSEFVHSIKT